MPDYAVSTAFKGTDQVTKVYKQMTAAAKTYEDRATKAFRRSSQEASRFGDIVKGVLVSGAIARGVDLLTQGAQAAAANFISLDDAAMAAAVRFYDLSMEGDNLTKSLNTVKGVAREVGRTTEYTATQAASALNFYAKAGETSAVAFKALPTTIDLATATSEDFLQVTDWITDLIGSFGLNVQDTTQKIENYARITDVMAMATNRTNVTMFDLFMTLKQAAPIGTAFGASMEEITAMTMTLGGNALKSTEAMTALKNTYARLVAPTADTVRGLNKLNIGFSDLVDESGRMRNIIDILDLFNERVNRLTQQRGLEALREVAGLEALAGFSILIKNNRLLKENLVLLNNAKGTNQRLAEIMRMSLGNQLKLLTSALAGVGDEFFQVFEVDIKRILPGFIERIQRFNIKPFAEGIRGLISFLGDNKEIFGIVGKGIGIFIGAMAISKVGAMSKAIWSLTAAVTGLNTALFANPAFWLAGAGLALWNFREEIGKFIGIGTAKGVVDINLNNAPDGTTYETSGGVIKDITINPSTMGMAP